MSGTIVTSAPRRSSSSASGLASGRVTTMRASVRAAGQSRIAASMRSAPRGKCFLRRAARRPRAARPRFETRTTSRPSTDATRPWRRTRGVAVAVARAATGAAQPPPRRCAGTRARPSSRRGRPDRRAPREARASRRRRLGTGSRALPGRARAASSRAPSSHSVTSCSSPSRRMPAAASTAASYSPFRDLPDPRIDVSADRADLEIGPKRRELRRAAKAARPDDGACRAARPAMTPARRRGSRARPRAPCHGADDDAGRILRRQILQRVHREVDLAVAQRPLELGGEEPLAADLGQRLAARLGPVAGRRDHACLALETRATPPSADATTRSVCARASAEARVPRVTAACSGGALTDRSGRRGRTGRGRRRRPRPRRRCLLARARARSGRGGASSRASARGARSARRRPDRRRRGRAARARPRAARIDSACLRSSERSGSTSSSRYRRPKPSTSLLDDRLDLGNLAEPRRHRAVEPGAQIVDVEEADARDLACLAVDVCRHGEIDDDERSARSTRHRRAHRRPHRRRAPRTRSR